MPVISHWIQTQHTLDSFCLIRTRKITRVEDHQPYPDHPERFDKDPQVLCVERLTGRCYWETEWKRRAEISVSYTGINRKGGSDCEFGFSDKSWSLNCSDNEFSVCHNKNSTDIPAVCSSSNRVGVYVDVSTWLSVLLQRL